jgi:hypothetical protein
MAAGERNAFASAPPRKRRRDASRPTLVAFEGDGDGATQERRACGSPVQDSGDEKR